MEFLPRPKELNFASDNLKVGNFEKPIPVISSSYSQRR